MIIKKITSSRIPNRAIVYFEDGSFLPLSVDDVYRQHLARGVDIDLVDTSFRYLLYQYALYQLSLSPKLPKELAAKLRTKYHYYSQKYRVSTQNLSTIIEAIIEDLEGRNFLSEEKYVESTIHRLSKKPLTYLLGYLRSKGVNVDNYRHLLVKDDLPLLRQVLTSKKYQNIKSADFKTKKRLVASLVRKGFAYNDIKSLIDYYPSD